MCGIAGFAGNGTREILAAMSQALIHRGPEGEGFHVDAAQGVFLAHRRLAILDIEGGRQPMWNEDQSVCVSFNGEIYNHLELRRELEACGHRFATDHSDTEVLVHGYEQWGEGLPLRLNGMFAFAIFDAPRRRLFLARDRFGEKPLYYAEQPGLFAFGSEVTALLRHPRVDRSIDPLSLQKYFAYSLLPAPRTLYRGIRKLRAGWWLRYDVRRCTLEEREYWRFRIEPQRAATSEEATAEELRHLLHQAVKRRLVADVPLGIFLSGGIDSSTVLAYARRELPAERTRTFSVGFSEPSYDESAYAREVALRFETQHHEQVLSVEAAADIMPEVLARLDEPLVDSSILPTALLCRFARTKVTVALGGDGGDELFAGYDPFRALAPARMYHALMPRPAHRLLRRAAAALPRRSSNMSLDFRLRRALRGLTYGPRFWNPVWLGALEPSELEELFEQPVALEELYEEALQVWEESTADNLVDRTLEFYTRIYLPDDILTKVDRASMLVSMEVRAPFLDNDLVDFARRLPHRLKYRHGRGKHLLRRAMGPILPPRVIARSKKGFGIPLSQWLRRWGEPANARASLPLQKDWVRRRWAEHLSGNADHRQFLWSWIALSSHLRAQEQPTDEERLGKIRLHG